MDSTIHWINHFPVNNSTDFDTDRLLGIDLSSVVESAAVVKRSVKLRKKTKRLTDSTRLRFIVSILTEILFGRMFWVQTL